LFCANVTLAKENLIFMNIIGHILGVTIESYGDHYPRLHLKLAMMCHVIKFSKSLALFFIVTLNMNFYTSRVDAHNPMNLTTLFFWGTKIKLSKHSNGC
jgi:hypothetical protein